MLLPLGPKGKLPDLPLMSIAIGLCTIAFSILSFRSLDQVITRAMKHEGYRVTHEKSEQFADQWCETNKSSIQDCALLKKHLIGFSLLSKKDLTASLDSTLSSPKTEVLKSELFAKNNKEKLSIFADDLFQQLSKLSEWQTWKGYVSENYAKGFWLTTKSIGFMSVIKAQFTHGGWFHLISNMVFFFAFAGALEIRLGIIAWLALYLVGGATGLLFQATASLPEGVPLVGASAGISALAGAYLVFFWRHPTRVLLSLGFYNKVILIPTFLFVLCLLAAQDIAGTMASMSPTAHLAHLSSLIFGMVFAVLHRFLVHRELAFLYPQEQQLFEEAANSKEALALYDQILVWNPDNVLVRDLAFAEANRDQIPSRARVAFYKFHLDEILTQLRRDKDYDKIVELARSISLLSEFKQILKILSPPQCLFVSRTLFQLESRDVLEIWLTQLPEIYPQLRQNLEYRNLVSQLPSSGLQGAISA